VTVGALGDLHFAAIIEFQHVILQRRITVSTGRVHTHSTFFAFVGCHWFSRLCHLGWEFLSYQHACIAETHGNRSHNDRKGQRLAVSDGDPEGARGMNASACVAGITFYLSRAEKLPGGGFKFLSRQ
jgi:hypothetical protein